VEGAILPLVSCRKTNPKVRKFEQAIALVCRRIKKGRQKATILTYDPRVWGFRPHGPCPG
jgi:hypothetical protein